MENNEEMDVVGGLLKITLWGIALVLAFPLVIGLLALRLAANVVFGGVADKISENRNQ